MQPDERENLGRIYADVFGSPNGRLVLEDMERVYRDRQSASVEDELAGIPHPFRAYYAEGQRSVVMALRALVEAARVGEL